MKKLLSIIFLGFVISFSNLQAQSLQSLIEQSNTLSVNGMTNSEMKDFLTMGSKLLTTEANSCDASIKPKLLTQVAAIQGFIPKVGSGSLNLTDVKNTFGRVQLLLAAQKLVNIRANGLSNLFGNAGSVADALNTIGDVHNAVDFKTEKKLNKWVTATTKIFAAAGPKGSLSKGKEKKVYKNLGKMAALIAAKV